jgi:mRNA-degrading endonuclease RelE of RelBE toxin-antitoxin system
VCCIHCNFRHPATSLFIDIATIPDIQHQQNFQRVFLTVPVKHAPASDPKPPAGDIKVMQGLKDGTMRLRVGSWRVLYRYGEENALEILLVLDIGNRGDIYK